MSKENKNKIKFIIQFIIIIQILILSNLQLTEDFLNSVANFSPTNENFHINSPIASDSWPGLTNGGFDTADNWYSEIEGDSTDHNTYISDGLANYDVIGETRSFTYEALPPNSTDWERNKNPEKPVYPEFPAGSDNTTAGVDDQKGLWAYHETDVGDRYAPSAHWVHDISMPVNMSGYEITDVGVLARFNASCFPTKIETEADSPTSYIYYDHIRIYVKVCDLSNTTLYEMADNRTHDYGDGEDNFNVVYPDAYLTESSNDDQIYGLTSVLATDDYNFRIIIGLDIICEPSAGPANDNDIWGFIFINYFKLNFTYVKKIDQFNTVSWNQDGDALPDSILINDATLKFEYNISSDWPTTSPNSEFRILINGNPHSETYKLSEINSTLREVNEAGINVKPLIEYVNLAVNREVNLSIQLYIADDFLHDHNITISIDDVSLEIDYTFTGTSYSTTWEIYLNGNETTANPQIDLPLGSILNITVKFINVSGGEFIPGAIVELHRLGEIDIFDEDLDLQQYNLSLNVDEQLLRGLNLLDLRADGVYYDEISTTLGVTIRKIETSISSVTGSNIIQVAPESDAFLQIRLDNEDSGETIKDVAVSYSSSLGSGILSDLDDDGIYNGTITNVPEGYYIVDINIIASDIYDFQPFQIGLNASAELLISTQWNIIFNNIDYTSNPTLDLPIGSSLNITVKYTNTSGDFIPSSTIQLIRAGYKNLDLIENQELKQYSLILDVDIVLVEGFNNIDLIAEKIGYANQHENLEFTLRKRFTLISSNSGSNIINLYPEGNTTLQVNITDLDFGGTIKNLTVTYSNPDLGSGILTDLDSDGIYEVKFVNIPEGSYLIEINVLSHEYYTFELYDFIINSISSLLAESSYQLILNGNETTADPSIELPIGAILNITVKFMNESGGFISGATIKIEKLGYIDYLNEDLALQQYSIIFEIDEILTRGINVLNINIKKIGYQVQTSDARITLRQIYTQISSESGSNRIDIEPGDTATIRIRLENLDYNENIRSVTVTYNWEFGQGTLSDINNDGIYEVALEDVPKGVYKIEIVVYANDSFIFETYEFTLAVQRPPNEVFAERVTLIAASVVVLGLATYVTIYQTKLKYPEDVRKLRKLRRSIKKGKRVKNSIDVAKRHEILAEKLKEDLEILHIRKYDVEKSDIALFMTKEDLQAVKTKQFEAELSKKEEMRMIERKAEEERLKKEQAAKQKAEQDRLKKEQAEKAKLEKKQTAKQKAEQDRLKKEQAAKQKAEQDRLKKEQAEKAKLEKERAAKQKAEQDRLKKEQAAKQKAEQDRLKKEQVEKAKLEKEQATKQKAEQDRLKKEQAAKQKAEQDRLKKEQAEKAKLEKKQTAKQKAEQDRLKKEQAAKQKAKQDRLKKEQAEKAKLEKERAAKQKAEQDRLKKEQAAKQKAEQDRLKKEQAEKAKLEKEKAKLEKKEEK